MEEHGFHEVDYRYMYFHIFTLSIYAVFLAHKLFLKISNKFTQNIITPTINVSDISINPHNPLSLVRIVGQRGGITGIVYKLLNKRDTYELHIGERLITMKHPGVSREYHSIIPSNMITSTYGGYQFFPSILFHGFCISQIGFILKAEFLIFFILLLSLILFFAARSMCIFVSSASCTCGYRFSSFGPGTDELVFRALEQIRLLLVRIQEGVPMPLPPGLAVPYRALPFSPPHIVMMPGVPHAESAPHSPHASAPPPAVLGTSDSAPLPIAGASAASSSFFGSSDPPQTATLLGVPPAASADEARLAPAQ